MKGKKPTQEVAFDRPTAGGQLLCALAFGRARPVKPPRAARRSRLVEPVGSGSPERGCRSFGFVRFLPRERHRQVWQGINQGI